MDLDNFGFALKMIMGIILLVAFFSTIIAIFVFKPYANENFLSLSKSDSEIAYEENWSAYYNGQEVDIHNVDLKQYNCSYNHEEKKVYLTYKTPVSPSSDGEWVWLYLLFH